MDQIYKSMEMLIKIQARIRGYLVRKHIQIKKKPQPNKI